MSDSKPISTISDAPNDSNLVSGGIVDDAEHNTHRTNYRNPINDLNDVVADLESNHSGSAEPTDKIEGKNYFDTDMTEMRFYAGGSGELATQWRSREVILTGATATYTMTDEANFVQNNRTASLVVTLLTAVGRDDKLIVLKHLNNGGSKLLTIDAAGSETIDGQLSIILNKTGDTVALVSDGANWRVVWRSNANIMPRGHISGLVISNDTDTTNDINISAGECKNSTGLVDIRLITDDGELEITKRIDAVWAVGDDQGGFPSGLTGGSPQNDTTYHVFVVLKNDGTVDAGFDTSLTAANLISDMGVTYVEFRHVGSILYGTATVVPFTARELAGGALEVLWDTPIFEFNKNWDGVDDAAQTGTLSQIVTGIQVNAKLGAIFQDGTNVSSSALLITSLDQADTAAAANQATLLCQLSIGDEDDVSGLVRASCELFVRTSTSGTFRYRANGSTADHLAAFCSIGFIDDRR